MLRKISNILKFMYVEFYFGKKIVWWLKIFLILCVFFFNIKGNIIFKIMILNKLYNYGKYWLIKKNSDKILNKSFFICYSL